MKFAEKCAFLPKSYFSSDFRESDMNMVYFVVRITSVKKLSISNRWLSLVRITLNQFPTHQILHRITIQFIINQVNFTNILLVNYFGNSGTGNGDNNFVFISEITVSI